MVMKSAFAGRRTPDATGFQDVDEAINDAVTTRRYDKLADLAKKLTASAQTDSSCIEPLLAVAGCLLHKEFYRSEAMSVYGTLADFLPANSLRQRVVDAILEVPDNLQKTSNAIVAAYVSAALYVEPNQDKENVATERFVRNVRLLDQPMSRINFYAITGMRARPGSILEIESLRGFKEEMEKLDLSRRVDQYQFIASASFPAHYGLGLGFREMAGQGLRECAKSVIDPVRLAGIYRSIMSCFERDDQAYLQAKANLAALEPRGKAPVLACG